MKPEKLFFVAAALTACIISAAQPRDTVFVSDRYTTHLIFSNEINYADLSNQTALAARIVDVSKNKLAIKARTPFASTASVSVEEATALSIRTSSPTRRSPAP